MDLSLCHLEISIENESLENLATKLPSLRQKPTSFTLFILSAIQSGLSLSKIESASYAIRFFYLLGEYGNTCKHILVVEMLETAKKLVFELKNSYVNISIGIFKLYEVL